MEITDLTLVTECLPYTSECARNVLHLIGPVEKYLIEKRYATDADVKQAVAS
jgi:hypothetical protein